MEQNVQHRAAAYQTNRTKRKRWHKVMTVLAAIVVFCTTYALILPAITDESAPLCGIQEHQHDISCYQYSVFTESCSGMHTHTASCYDANGNTVCGQPDILLHTHDTLCYSAAGDLICPLQEQPMHIHDASCYIDWATVSGLGTELTSEPESSEPVTSVEDTVTKTESEEIPDIPSEETTNEIPSNSEFSSESETASEPEFSSEPENSQIEQQEENLLLICGQTETALHFHLESCYDQNGMLICGKPQVTEHRHDASCLTILQTETPVCGIEEHLHDEILCYTDPNVVEETAEVWEATLPQNLSGIWTEDLIAVAYSQLGYTESSQNVQTAPDGTLRGATRYGS